MPNVIVFWSIASTYAFCPSVFGRMLLPRLVRIAWLEHLGRAALAALEDARGTGHVDRAEVDPVAHHLDQLVHETFGGRDLLGRPLEGHLIAPDQDDDLGELMLDRGQQPILGPSSRTMATPSTWSSACAVAPVR